MVSRSALFKTIVGPAIFAVVVFLTVCLSVCESSWTRVITQSRMTMKLVWRILSKIGNLRLLYWFKTVLRALGHYS
jgi:hypothetical protein